jgi:ankyrin repeat protein/uncharacterized protein DUF3471
MKVRGGVAVLIVLLSGSLILAQDAKQQLNDQLFEAARAGDEVLVASLLDKGADVNAKFRYGTTALFKAAERGHAKVVKILLDRGADATIRDTFYKTTAMTWALDHDHADVVALLLEKVPGSVNEVLMTGAREGNPALVKVALAKTITPDNLTAALAAASDGDPKPEVVELLKAAGAKPPLAVPEATLQSYVGKYTTEQPNAPEITVALKQGNLIASAQGQTFRLMALDNTTFRITAFDGVKFSFQVEGSKVTGLSFMQGTNTTKYKRVD